jgi:hypothetical protein
MAHLNLSNETARRSGADSGQADSYSIINIAALVATQAMRRPTIDRLAFMQRL